MHDETTVYIITIHQTERPRHKTSKETMAEEYRRATASSPGRASVTGRHRSNRHQSAMEAEESAKAKKAAAIRQLHQHLTEQGPRYRRRNVLEDGESSESGSSNSNCNDVDDDNNYYHGRAAGGHERDVTEDDDINDDDSVSVLSMFTKRYEDIVGPDDYGHEEDSDSESPTPRRPPRRISVITKRKSVEKNDAADNEDDGLSDESEEEKEVDDGHAEQRRQRKGLAGFLKLAHEDDPRQGSAGSLSYDEIIGKEQFFVPHNDFDANEQHKTSGVLVDFQTKAGERLPRRRRRRSYQEDDDNDDDKEDDHDRDAAKKLKELEEELALLRKHRTMRSAEPYPIDDNVEETKQNDKHQSPPTMKWESTRGHSGLARRRVSRRSSRLSRDSSNERSAILNAALHDSNVSAGGSESDFPGANDASNGNLSTGDLSGDISAGLEELRRRMATANIKAKQDPISASASEVQPESNTARRGSNTRRGRRQSSGIMRHLSSGLSAECSGGEMEDTCLSGPLKGHILKRLTDSLRSMDSGEEEALEIKSVGEIMEDFPQASYEVYDLKGSDDEDGPRCQPRRSSRRRSSMAESDDESINSRSSMASNAFSAVLSLAEELMVNSDDVPFDATTMPEKTQHRRNRSVASASSVHVGPDIAADKRQNKRRSSFDAGALGDLLVGKSSYLKTVEMEEEALRGGLGQEDFHASMLLWDANKSSKANAPNESKEGQCKDQDHYFSGYLNDCIPEIEEELQMPDANSCPDLADRPARSLQRAKSADAFPSKRRKCRRRKSRDTSSAQSVGSLNTLESLEFSDIAEKSMQTEEYEEAPTDVAGRPRKSILKHMSSLSLESLDIESKVIELDLNDDLANVTTPKNERSMNERRSAQPRSSISSIPSVVLDALGDELEAEGEGADKGKEVKTATRSSGQRASSRASLSSIPSVVLSALENEVDSDADLEVDAQVDVAIGDDVPKKPSAPGSRPQRSRSSSFASVPSIVLDTLQNELAADGTIDGPPERLVGNRDDSSKTHLSKPSSLRELQPNDPTAASRQPSEDSSPEIETDRKIKRQVTRKGSLNALLGLLPNLEDELEEEADVMSPLTKHQGGREIRKALSFDKLKAIMNDSLTTVAPDDNGVDNNDSNSTFGGFDKPNRLRERSSSLGRLKDIMDDLVGDDSNSSLPKAPPAVPANKGMLASMDSTRAFDYDHESSIMQAMGREAPAHYNARAVAEKEERRKSAGKAGFGGMFQSIMANLGSEEAD